MTRPHHRDRREGLRAPSEEKAVVQPLRIEAKRLAREESRPDPAELAKRFFEPLRGEEPPKPRPPISAKPILVPREVFPGQQVPASGEPSEELQDNSRFGRNALVSALVVLALIPLAILFVRLWQDTMTQRTGAEAVPALGQVASSAPAVRSQPAPQQTGLEVALSSPDR